MNNENLLLFTFFKCFSLTDAIQKGIVLLQFVQMRLVKSKLKPQYGHGSVFVMVSSDSEPALGDFLITLSIFFRYFSSIFNKH